MQVQIVNLKIILQYVGLHSAEFFALFSYVKTEHSAFVHESSDNSYWVQFL